MRVHLLCETICGNFCETHSHILVWNFLDSYYFCQTNLWSSGTEFVWSRNLRQLCPGQDVMWARAAHQRNLDGGPVLQIMCAEWGATNLRGSWSWRTAQPCYGSMGWGWGGWRGARYLGGSRCDVGTLRMGDEDVRKRSGVMWWVTLLKASHQRCRPTSLWHILGLTAFFVEHVFSSEKEKPKMWT